MTYFHPYTLNPELDTDVHVPSIGNPCCGVSTWHEAMLRWFDGNVFSEESRIEPLIKDLEEIGLPVGGIANCVAPIAHTQGWLHCDIPATDASGATRM